MLKIVFILNALLVGTTLGDMHFSTPGIGAHWQRGIVDYIALCPATFLRWLPLMKNLY